MAGLLPAHRLPVLAACVAVLSGLSWSSARGSIELPHDPGVTPPPIPVSWSTSTSKWQGQFGRRETLLCPANGTPRSAFGTDIYTDDSSVCTAAVHAGLITPRDGGAVTIEVRPDQSQYLGSERNGIQSGDWFDMWPASFIFLWGDALDSPAPAIQASSATQLDSWNGQAGRVLTFHCPARFELQPVSGTDVYTDDSAVCSAAVHAGVIKQAHGGMVTVKLQAEPSSFSASTRHGITSFAMDGWKGQSFTFVATPADTPPPPTATTPFLPPPGKTPQEHPRQARAASEL